MSAPDLTRMLGRGPAAPGRPGRQSERHAASCVALIGHSNVGKSALFQRLTGQRALVSNYPGTTVELGHGRLHFDPGAELLDTPGVRLLPAQSADEQVTERVLFEQELRAVVQVGDAKHLFRTLLLTVQLAEMRMPLVLALNMADEAAQRGLEFDPQSLSSRLGIPVVPTVAVDGDGLAELGELLKSPARPDLRLRYPRAIDRALRQIVPHLPQRPISAWALALLFLSRDPIAEHWLEQQLDGAELGGIRRARELAQSQSNDPLSSQIQLARAEFVERVLLGRRRELAPAEPLALRAQTAARHPLLADRLGDLAAHPLWGLPILVGVLAALYAFVGVLGAQVLVDWMEGTLFGAWINPWVADWVGRLAPYPLVEQLLVGPYGLWTMGLTYALALVLPIVATFFLAFGVLEDSGYFARLAVLTNRLFRRLGLNGRAVMPMVLGLGCVTVATLATRTLESKRERLLVTLLLALAVPCSAQLGVVMGMLGGLSLGALLIWGSVVVGLLLSVGWLASRLLPGEQPDLLLELPPLRLPRLSNLLVKTSARLEWYLKEVVPLFLLGAAAITALDATGALRQLVRLAQPVVVDWLGLPPQATTAFLLGLLRRDFGATGLFVLGTQGLLTPDQVLVAMVSITLFVPCVASILMMAKERGWRTALGITTVIFPLALLVGGVLHRLLPLLGWGA